MNRNTRWLMKALIVTGVSGATHAADSQQSLELSRSNILQSVELAGDGLVIEAAPTLYDDHWLDVRTVYYEKDRTGQQRRISTGRYGILTKMPDGSPGIPGGGQAMIVGSKAYSITEIATAAPL